ncbi:hypothetical protein J4437_05835 [Candidatus Woesearchaeota archaeon]|nr:hypothetical protein [Candidatus Woesearchaeota archaeon]
MGENNYHEKKKDLEETLKEKVSPLLEESMSRNWGITIPKIESDITDKLKNPQSMQIYIPSNLSFSTAKKRFKKEFLKKELRFHLGNISQLARSLKINRRSIHRVINSLDIGLEDIHNKSETYNKDKNSKIEETVHEKEIKKGVDKTIRSTLENYKNIIQPQKMEKMYADIPGLSRNIAKFLPHQEITWKEAERDFERQFLSKTLIDNKGEINKTAKRLKIRVETLYRKIKRYGLK